MRLLESALNALDSDEFAYEQEHQISDERRAYGAAGVIVRDLAIALDEEGHDGRLWVSQLPNVILGNE
jgi:hypothetical protein